MSRYRSRSEMDDAMITNGDGGFIGFETRRHPTQLESGLIRFSQNLRMENNVATVRKGIDRLTSDLQTTVDKLTLPFTLGGEVSLVSITSSGTTATATLTATPTTAYTNGDGIEIQGADQSEYNGSFTLTVVSPTVFTYVMLTDPAVDTATGTLTASPLLPPSEDGAFASTLFSDVETDNEYIAMATLDKVVLVDPDDPTNSIDIPYAEPNATSPAEQYEAEDNGSMVQVGNGLVIHRGKNKKALEWDGILSNVDAINVTSLTRSSSTVTVVTEGNHSYQTGDIITIAGANDSDYDGDKTITITNLSTFTYSIATTPTSPDTGTITAARIPQFFEVADTNFNTFLSMPQAEFSEYHPFARLIVPVRVIFFDVNSLSRSGQVATATMANPHGLQVGDRITVSGVTDAEYNGMFDITSVTSTSVTYVVSGTPSATGSGANKKITVDVRDQFIVSDIYDHKTYDPVTNLFRINRGTADGLVALKTWQNNNLIALYEKSVHVITDIAFADLSNSVVFLITDEVGCIARKTVEIIGDKIVFLSELGVYILDITPELNLRGKEIPLSKDIQDEFTTTNLNYAKISDSVAVYFNNRYYIAVPSNGSTRNDIVYVYNFINGKWESKDTFASANYIDDWVVARKDGKERLFATSKEGSVQLWEELDHDELGSSPTNTEIVGQLISRRYTGGNATNLTQVTPFSPLEVNKFHRASINLDVLNGDVMTVTANTENPDSTTQVASYTFAAAEDHMKRTRINKRGTGCEIQIDTTTGRPTIRSLSMEISESQRANKNFE